MRPHRATRRATLLLAASLVAAAPATAQDPGGRLTGRVADRDGAPAAGAVVTVRGAADIDSTADEDGRFTFAGLSAGTYTITATADGFTPASSTVVLTAPTTRSVDMTLLPSCINGRSGVPDLGIATNITAADAVVYVRVRDAGRKTRLSESEFCVDGYEHRGDVLGIVKAPAHIAATIRLVRAGPQPYRAGDRYVVFLHLHPSGAFLDLGDNAFLVQGGRVRWTRTDLPGVADDAPVERVMGGLQDALSMTR